MAFGIIDFMATVHTLAAEKRIMNHKGFTLIELVIVIVLIVIIAVYVAPRLGDVTAMKAGAFADKLRADIRYAQNLAMTQNQRVRVTFAANSYSITIAGNPIADPASGRNYPVALGAGDYTGISITTPTGFSGDYVEFNSLGVPYDSGGALAADKSVTVTGGQTVLVTAQTGAVN
jgi:prepilin-type N-terminal cleavage/methylation domain-containing protein